MPNALKAAAPASRLDLPVEAPDRMVAESEDPAVDQAPELMIDVEETIEGHYLHALGRFHWEEAFAVLHAVTVSDGTAPPRRYGPDDEWRETIPDPRRRYKRAGGFLKRRCEAGVDYDPDRHLVRRTI